MKPKDLQPLQKLAKATASCSKEVSVASLDLTVGSRLAVG